MRFNSLILTKRSSKVDIPQKSLNLCSGLCHACTGEHGRIGDGNLIQLAVAVPHNHFNHKILDYTMAHCEYMPYNFSSSYNNV